MTAKERRRVLRTILESAQALADAWRNGGSATVEIEMVAQMLRDDCRLETELRPTNPYWVELAGGLKIGNRRQLLATLQKLRGVVLQFRHGLLTDVRDLGSTAAAAAEELDELISVLPSSGPSSLTLVVDVETRVAQYSAPGHSPEHLDIDDEDAARWLKQLADRPGTWVTMSDAIGQDILLDGARSDRLKAKLPQKIRRLIECRPGKGCRLKPPRL